MTAGDRLNLTPSCPRCQTGSMRYASNTLERDRPRNAAMKSECRAAVLERSRSWSSETHQPVDICRPRACGWSPAAIREPEEHPPGVASRRVSPPSLPGRLPGRITVRIRTGNARRGFDYSAVRQ